MKIILIHVKLIVVIRQNKIRIKFIEIRNIILKQYLIIPGAGRLLYNRTLRITAAMRSGAPHHQFEV